MRFFTALADGRTWRELFYALIGFPIGVAGFVWVVTSLSVSLSLIVTLIGIPLLALAIAAARGLGGGYRAIGRALLGVEVDNPIVRRRPGVRGWLTEINGWRAIAFLLLDFPISIIDFTVAVSFWSMAVGATTYPIWRHTIPTQTYHGVAHRGAQLYNGYFLDTAPRILATFLAGIVLLLLAPWAVRAVVSIDRFLIANLLGPTEGSRRIAQLEQTRAMAIDDSAASLRRIERDLHDGAQARLVSLAMNLGLAKEELDASEDPEASLTRVRELVESAHRDAKGTIVELRDLARGIHPPALDNGLPDALGTLAARCSVPTQVHIDLPNRPSQAIETIVYFCTAELLTNVVKHSGAHHANIDVRVIDARLYVRVGDDGAGGAERGRSGGTGIAGLVDRLSTVDGRIDIASPEGGPTLVTIQTPLT
ncbi:MAG TPA: sensor domain-containing protein [Mycobacteriales bacterium]|nr:sensor domain-containing protein [Mycobacteriales bacterium]